MDKSAFGVYSKPNFFELFLREHIDESLYKAFRFVAKTLCSHAPDSAVLGFVSRHKTAVFCALMGATEAYSLARHSATLAERFLGMECVPTRTSTCGKQGLTAVGVALSLCAVLGVPLAMRQLRRVAKRYSAGGYFTEDDEHGEAFRARCARLVAILYPYLKAASGLAAFSYTVAYIGGLTRYASPWLHLAGMKLATAQPPGSSGGDKGAAGGVLAALGKGVGDALRLVLPLVAFGYRSLEWWYSIPEAVSGATAAQQQEALPPAPEPPRVCSGVSLPSSERCPLCGKVRTNPAVLAPSGFAFCYPCVVKYVREYSRCPVTGLPANEAQIRRLFVK